MTPENEINEEVRQLLDSLEEHGKNARRQKELGELINQLSEKELGTGTSLRGGTTKQSRREATSQSNASTSDETSSLDCFVPRNDAKRRKLIPLWWTMGAAAACLLLWLLVKPNAKQQPEMEQEILVEETKTMDSMETKVEEVIIEEPVFHEALLAEETPIVPQRTQVKKEKPRTEIVEQTIEQPALAEVPPTEPKDTTNIGSNTIPTSIEEKLSTLNSQLSTQNRPQRRVIRSLNLVCYECQKDPEFFIKPVLEDKTLFGQPQDPNMKNG